MPGVTDVVLFYSSALHAPLPDDPMQAGNLADIVEVRLFKTGHCQRIVP